MAMYAGTAGSLASNRKKFKKRPQVSASGAAPRALALVGSDAGRASAPAKSNNTAGVPDSDDSSASVGARSKRKTAAPASEDSSTDTSSNHRRRLDSVDADDDDDDVDEHASDATTRRRQRHSSNSDDDDDDDDDDDGSSINHDDGDSSNRRQRQRLDGGPVRTEDGSMARSPSLSQHPLKATRVTVDIDRLRERNHAATAYLSRINEAAIACAAAVGAGAASAICQSRDSAVDALHLPTTKANGLTSQHTPANLALCTSVAPKITFTPLDDGRMECVCGEKLQLRKGAKVKQHLLTKKHLDSLKPDNVAAAHQGVCAAHTS